MLAPLKTLEQIVARLAETIDSLPLTRPKGFVSLVLELPQALTMAPDVPGPQFQFAHNHRGEIRAGYGVASEWTAHGEARLQTLRIAAKRMSEHWDHLDPDETGFSGFAMLGFAASPGQVDQGWAGDPEALPNALLWLPELALCSSAGQAAVILSTALPADPDQVLARWKARLEQIVPRLNQPALDPLTPACLDQGPTEPDVERWQDLVLSALEQIEQEQLQKVVICRRLRLEGHRRFDLTRLNAALAYLFPSCQVVTIRRHTDSFVAATPERLFTQQRDRIEVDAIAGTVCRAPSADHDAALTSALRTSSKNLHEHMVVVDAVSDALSHCSRLVEPPDGPRVMQLNNAQHLWSIIRAELDPGMDVFQLAELLHPTPATNGHPCELARAWLRRAEPIQRGWYTGAAGIIEPDLTGELWVLLRCARINERTADLYAGAGIVAGSDPDSEWQETEHKLAAMSTALQFA
jgi:menaquinone-specific isochorismate synthase